MLTTSRLADAVRLCNGAVSLDFQVDTSALRNAGWGYTQPVQRQMDGQSFDYIEFHKNDVVISLLDFGNFLMCRVGGVVAGEARFVDLRTATAASLGAVRLADATALAAFNEGTMQNSPSTDPDDLFVLGGYSLEFAHQELPADAVSAGAQLVLVTSVPIPAQFRTGTDQQPAE